MQFEAHSLNLICCKRNVFNITDIELKAIAAPATQGARNLDTNEVVGKCPEQVLLDIVRRFQSPTIAASEIGSLSETSSS